MKRLVIQRLFSAIGVVLGACALVFLILYMLPGDPVQRMLDGAPADENTIMHLREQLGLDLPLHQQFLNYMGNLLQGDFGHSFVTQEPVLDRILEQLPATIQLTVMSMGVAVVFGVTLGILSALKSNTWIDFLVRVVSLFGVSMPTFWSGILLILLFGVTLGWLPTMGSEGFQSLILPSLALGFVSAGYIVRMVRNSVLETIQDPYVTTLRAKGLSDGKVTYLHVFRNALIPAITMIGVQVGELLAGAVVIETVFSRQGIGRLVADAIITQDFPVVQGVVIVTAVVYVLVNFTIDLSYSAIDPRIRRGAG
ncbi:ABC transporter permease [Geomicrobium sp. JCM 19039]|uniref:ABC transporter permease n=1 Tax=Geomicrobium sp. JCM 19039 TaxID=1460636 RepID=UPI00045F41FB|nr:ABC transporter permease [Geomicrobium sp. JCM 19039]GAK13052.1 dipeptide transport system permease protein DppB [Geomicrobium sp. JCM 19039]